LSAKGEGVKERLEAADGRTHGEAMAVGRLGAYPTVASSNKCDFSLLFKGMIVWITFLLLSVGAVDRTLPRDASVLRRLFDDFGGWTWKSRAGWEFLGDDPCNERWFGVACNLQGRVVSLSLSSNHVTGREPPRLRAHVPKAPFLRTFPNWTLWRPFGSAAPTQRALTPTPSPASFPPTSPPPSATPPPPTSAN
jgi:hypothetical protein